MKTHILLAALCGMFASCENLPVVQNRNADGTYKKASEIACPQCGVGFHDTATVYWHGDPNHFAVAADRGSSAFPKSKIISHRR